MSKVQNNYTLRHAIFSDQEVIWEIIKGAVLRRKEEGSNQWQDGYPNPDTIASDIENKFGYVLLFQNRIVAYVAIIFEPEPAYEKIVGSWLSSNPYVVIHRVAVHADWLGKGMAKNIFEFAEEIALSNEIYSIRVDTNFDNLPMLNILKKLKYVYCGEVHFRGSARKAFEKML